MGLWIGIKDVQRSTLLEARTVVFTIDELMNDQDDYFVLGCAAKRLTASSHLEILEDLVN